MRIHGPARSKPVAPAETSRVTGPTQSAATVGPAMVRSTTSSNDLVPATALATGATVASARVGRSSNIAISKGATAIPDRATFEKLARRDNVPGALGVREVKFLMTGVDTAQPRLYFVNTNNIVYHWDFATKALGQPISLEEFNRTTYWTDRRSNLAGSILAHDNFEGPRGRKGLYALEFWPTDPVKARHVKMAFDAIKRAMPFAASSLAYHPAGDTQEALAEQEKATLRAGRVKTVTTTALFDKMKFGALNPGEGFGTLRVFDGTRPGDRPPSVRDVVIFKTIPNDLTHVGGIITEQPQTPLSHINLKARQNDTPNAFIKDATSDPKVKALMGKLVHYKVTPDGYELRAASPAEAEAFLDKMRPPRVTRLPRNLSVKTIKDLDVLGHGDLKAFGAKAANVAELRKIMPAGTVPDGFAVPFEFYDRFMKETGLYDKAKAMMADPAFKSDPAVRERKLDEFRRLVRRADVPADLQAALRREQAKYPTDQPLRCRSSTNNEDMEGFNGAGLYDSYTHRPDEGGLESTIKQVWSSLWNYRAFEEREFHRVDHLSAAMGVLVHPNFDDERANGVAVTRNIYDPNWKGFYVNVQVGESLVTNPDAGATPDEFLVSAIGPRGEYETQYVRHSSEVRGGGTVMNAEQVRELTAAMDRIQQHFKVVYGKQHDPKFAMDIEFKFNTDGKLVVKQARPWVE